MAVGGRDRDRGRGDRVPRTAHVRLEDRKPATRAGRPRRFVGSQEAMSAIGRDVPPTRVRAANDCDVRADGAFVLYWMTAARRTRFNFALERAVGWAIELGRPLVVLEALRVAYPWASDRHHAFVVDGMRDNERALSAAGALYFPYVERRDGDGRGLVEALARDACVVITDDAPFFFLGRMLASAAPRLPVRVEAIDGNGLMPLRAITQRFTFAHQFRRFVQKTIRPHLVLLPIAEPLRGQRLPSAHSVTLPSRWLRVSSDELADSRAVVARLPIDHRVPIVEDRGGSASARARLDAFVRSQLLDYEAPNMINTCNSRSDSVLISDGSAMRPSSSTPALTLRIAKLCAISALT